LTALQTQTAAAAPLDSATFATLKAIQLNSQQLETDTTAALYAAAGALDTWVASRDSASIVAGFQAIVESAADEWRILDMLSVISRANLNVSLLLNISPPTPS
jgi:hypothetical protein